MPPPASCSGVDLVQHRRGLGLAAAQGGADVSLLLGMVQGFGELRHVLEDVLEQAEVRRPAAGLDLVDQIAQAGQHARNVDMLEPDHLNRGGHHADSFPLQGEC
jgi:hypothetical protein